MTAKMIVTKVILIRQHNGGWISHRGCWIGSSAFVFLHLRIKSSFVNRALT